MKNLKKINLLIEMRPALDGHAGIPQETRLLFRGLCTIPEFKVEGLLQTSHHFLSSGSQATVNKIGADLERDTEEVLGARKAHQYAKIIIGIESQTASKKPMQEFKRYLKKKRTEYKLSLGRLISSKPQVKLTVFEPTHFKDFIWRRLFAKTLPVSDFDLVMTNSYRVCSTPWNVLQSCGLTSLKYSKTAQYPRLDTDGLDVFIAQTPYPGCLSPNTQLVVRYHDAFPILMPHTIAHPVRHEATHFYALQSNVASGAFFSCVSEASRQDLLRLYPELEDRAVTIPNMVSHSYLY